ncbi:hypothetical protein [Porphyrobacter sp. LM 6]|uniref:hypothetical protein n=1 Tax=Porphyrobacter sp. LM 6 TaxID=1896196 RepID=UPI000863C031|nr:hypothetical protein [Porphyrobacter sp. LM 6]AOL94946.1 hypothetical protein BG023_112030 [Porphyrobacter sp. LM 6]
MIGWRRTWMPNAQWSELPTWAKAAFVFFFLSLVVQASGYVSKDNEVYVFLAGFVPMIPAVCYMAYLNLSEATRTGNDG